MSNGFLQIRNNFDRCWQNTVPQNRTGLFTTVNCHIMHSKCLLHHRQQFFCNCFMHQQAFNCIANRWTLRLGVVNNPNSHFIICIAIQTGIYIDVTISDTRFNDWNGCLLDNCLNQACSTSWNQNIQIAIQLHHIAGSLSGGIFYQLHDICRQANGFHRFPHDIH